MRTDTSPFSPRQLRSQPHTEKPAEVPGSFREALSLGWAVVREESIVGDGRRGVILLRLREFPVRLRIPFSLRGKAWKFGTPEAIGE